MASKLDVDIVVYVEHAVREMDVACILRHVMREKYGMRLEVLPLRFREYQNLTENRPTVVVLSGFFNDDSGARRWRHCWPNAVYANLAYEQVFQKINAPFKRPRTPFGLERLLYSAWGQFNVDYLTGWGVPEKHIQINGNPVYALYRDPYRSRCLTREQLAEKTGLDPKKRWFFIPENYHSAFFDPRRIATYAELGVTEEQALAFREFGNQSLELLCRWLQNIPENVEVILRPRPATPNDAFMEKVLPWLGGSIPRGLTITKESTAREWVLNSDAVCSSYSTTLIEAAIAGKSVYMLEPVAFPEFVMNEWYGLVDHVVDESQFSAALAGSTEAGDSGRLAKWAEETMMAGGDPIQNVAAWLASLVEKGRTQPKAVSPAKVEARRWAALFRRYNRLLRTKLTGRKEGGHAHDFFTAEDVDRLTAEWAAHLSKQTGK